MRPFESTICALGFLLGNGVLYLILGLLPTALLSRRLKLRPQFLAPTFFVVLGFLGWGAFWIFVWSAPVGRAAIPLFSCALGIFTAVDLVKNRYGSRELLFSRDFGGPLSVGLAVSALYLWILFTRPMGSFELGQFVSLRFFGLPNDNFLPYFFADKLYHGEAVSPLFGDWLSSDRPPLQAGIVLWQMLLSTWAGWPEMGYQTAATLLQASFVCALWALAGSIALGKSARTYLLLFIPLTGFALVHSVFTWPKLLAASYALFAVSIWFAGPLSLGSALFLGMAAAFALLSHGGAVFTLVPLGCVALVTARRQPQELLVALGACVLIYAPWIAYQALIDPPGNRLVKMHLAGINAVTAESPLSSIWNAYARLSWWEIWKMKWSNVQFIMGPFAYGQSYQDALLQFRYSDLRRYEFFHTVVGLGPALLGIVPLLWRVWDPAWRGQHRALLVAGGLAISSLMFWVALLFGGFSASIHQGSFATQLLLYVVLATVLSQISKPIAQAILILNAVWFLKVWCG